jgi:hypothetical protein
MKNKSRIKQQLLSACHQVIDERISLIEKNLSEVQESRNNETKSSAGDKYETGRAMLQIEEDNYQKQLHQAMLVKNQLQQTDPARDRKQADRGSMVVTSQGQYFISAGLGQITLEGQTYLCISPASPIGQQLMGQETGFRFVFNGAEIEIKEVC